MEAGDGSSLGRSGCVYLITRRLLAYHTAGVSGGGVLSDLPGQVGMG